MFDYIRALVLRLMRVPHDPEPPAGAPQSVRVFRASENFYKLRLFGWTVTQLFAVAGIVFWILMLGNFADRVDESHIRVEIARVKAAAAKLAPAKAPSAEVTPAPAPSAASAVAPTTPPNPPAEKAAKKKSRGNRDLDGQFAKLDRVPSWTIWVLRTLELFGIASFVAQLPITLAMLRLDYELRWYIVTDRSLRIRTGIWRVQEMTMSFANIQQVAVTRGPIQGLLKICDVRVQSAGGGSGHPQHGHGDTLHTGIFHGVANAEEIRDLILERLRQFRAAGLGDPDDAHDTHATPPMAAAMANGTHSALDAAKEVLAEARALRAAL